MISVIVPVYNVEYYLSRCIDSLLNQTYSEMEVLLIDDGSTDRSGQICDQYSKKDEHIKVFHKPNGGLSDARNYGLERMQGDYVTFVDSDDYVGREYLEILINAITQYRADVSAISFKTVYTIEPVYTHSSNDITVFTGEEIFRELLKEKQLNYSACGRLFKKEIFHDKKFPKGKLFEELFTIPYLFDNLNICACSTSIQYYYFWRDGSIMNSASEQSINDWIEAITELLKYTYRTHPQDAQYAERIFLRGVFWRVIDWKLQSNDYSSVANKIHNDYSAIFQKSITIPDLTKKEKIKSILFWINVCIYRTTRIAWIKTVDNPDSRHFLKKG